MSRSLQSRIDTVDRQLRVPDQVGTGGDRAYLLAHGATTDPALLLVRPQDCDCPATWAEVQASLAAYRGDEKAFFHWAREERRLRPDPAANLPFFEQLEALAVEFAPGCPNRTGDAVKRAIARLGGAEPDRAALRRAANLQREAVARRAGSGTG